MKIIVQTDDGEQIAEFTRISTFEIEEPELYANLQALLLIKIKAALAQETQTKTG